MERMVVCPHVKKFMTNQFIHDLKGLSLHYQCGDYQFDVGNNGFECH